jgi:NAD+ synthase (glutamine-hydrolysing)
LNDVEVISAKISLSSLRSYRKDIPNKGPVSSSSSGNGSQYSKIHIPHFSLFSGEETDGEQESPASIQASFVSIEEEVVKSTACYLYDYLRRSNATGLVLSLTGNINSTAVALIVRMMCEMMSKAVLTDHNSSVKTFAETIIGRVRILLLFSLSLSLFLIILLFSAYSGFSLRLTKI